MPPTGALSAPFWANWSHFERIRPIFPYLGAPVIWPGRPGGAKKKGLRNGGIGYDPCVYIGGGTILLILIIVIIVLMLRR